MPSIRPCVFRDPIHGLIRLDDDRELLLKLIATPEFQRLRRIRQLGSASLVYPGAEHTRFNHSLGVLHLTQRMLDILKRATVSSSVPARLMDEHGRLIKAAALLHDTGHGPFSHLMERAFEASADHEARSQSVITVSESRIRDVLSKAGLDPVAVTDVIGKRFPHKFLIDLVSSQLDADRMDYLLRDAHFTGVRYGVYDLDWILNALSIAEVEGGNSHPAYRLCLDAKRGLHSAEQLLLARQHMTLQVYAHRTVRRWEAHLICLLRAAADFPAERLPSSTPKAVIEYLARRGAVDHATFLKVDEPLLMAAMTIWTEHPGKGQRWGFIRDMAGAFLRREHLLEVYELEPAAESEFLGRALEGLGENAMNRWFLDDTSVTGYKMPDREQHEEDPEAYRESVNSNSILLTDSDGGTQAVQEISPIFRTLGQHRPRRIYLFFHPSLREKIDKRLNSLKLQILHK